MSLLGNMGLKKPCHDCPFRSDVPRYLAPARYLQIAESLVDRGESFTCHKTNDFSGDEVRVTDKSCSCAGAMIWLQHQDKPNQLMQVMERLGAFDPKRLNMEAPVYRTRQEFEEGLSG
jgi:hypothetical protein